MKCITCQAEIPESWIRYGTNGACRYRDDNLGLVAACSDGCFNDFIVKQSKENSHGHKLPHVTVSAVPTNKAKKASPFRTTIPVRWAKEALFNIRKFRQLDGDFTVPGAADLGDPKTETEQ